MIQQCNLPEKQIFANGRPHRMSQRYLIDVGNFFPDNIKLMIEIKIDRIDKQFLTESVCLPVISDIDEIPRSQKKSDFNQTGRAHVVDIQSDNTIIIDILPREIFPDVLHALRWKNAVLIHRQTEIRAVLYRLFQPHAQRLGNPLITVHRNEYGIGRTLKPLQKRSVDAVRIVKHIQLV